MWKFEVVSALPRKLSSKIEAEGAGGRGTMAEGACAAVFGVGASGDGGGGGG